MTELRIDAAAGDLRRSLGPVAWFVLEELLLCEGERAGDTFVAQASARSLARAVSLNKDTVARALTLLAEAGVIEPLGQRQEAGRFASGAYRIADCPGIARLGNVLQRSDEVPTRRLGADPAPSQTAAQLSLLDVPAGSDAHDRPALPGHPQPSDALAPPARPRPGRRSRPGNVSAGMSGMFADGTTDEAPRPC